MRRGARAWIVSVFLVGALAPLLANDRPILARAAGALCSPALAAWLGRPAPPPGGGDWREWWENLAEDSSDWAIMPPWPWGPSATSGAVNAPPSFAHPLGCDDTGRDQLARLLWGASTSMGIGLGAVAAALLLGLPLGLLAGYRGGLADTIVLRLIELGSCFPALPFVLAVGAFAGRSAWSLVLVLGVVYWTGIARMTRGELLHLREREFVLAARGLGVGAVRLWWRHLLPALRGPLSVALAFTMAAAIVVELTLSFLGLGPGGAVSWGAMLHQGKVHAHEGAWHLWLFPALAVACTVWSLHALAEPRLRADRRDGSAHMGAAAQRR